MLKLINQIFAYSFGKSQTYANKYPINQPQITLLVDSNSVLNNHDLDICSRDYITKGVATYNFAVDGNNYTISVANMFRRILIVRNNSEEVQDYYVAPGNVFAERKIKRDLLSINERSLVIFPVGTTTGIDLQN